MTQHIKIKNLTHQGLEIVAKLPSGQFDHIWLESKKSIIIPAQSITELIRSIERRQMIKITNV